MRKKSHISLARYIVANTEDERAEKTLAVVLYWKCPAGL